MSYKVAPNTETVTDCPLRCIQGAPLQTIINHEGRAIMYSPRSITRFKRRQSTMLTRARLRPTTDDSKVDEPTKDVKKDGKGDV
jgi:hypothetical protein